MHVWRIAKQAYAQQLTGEGNRRTGARWNSPGRPVVYTSEVLSLAVLELLAHTSLRWLPKDLTVVKLLVPEHPPKLEISLESFPVGWETGSHDGWFRRTGDDWLASSEAFYLRAPSIIVPEDYNIMLNPLHSAMSEVRIVTQRPFNFMP